MIKKIPNAFFVFLNEMGFVLRESGIIFGAMMLGSLALFVANIVLARLFEPEAFGSFKIVLNLALLVPALLDLGAGVTLVKYISEFTAKTPGKSVHLVRFFLKLRAVAFVLGIILLFFLKNIFGYLFYSGQVNDVMLTAGIVVVAATFFDIFSAILLGYQRFRIYAGTVLVSFVTIAILTCTFGYFGGIVGALVGWGIGIFIGDLLPMYLAINEIRGKKVQQFSLKPIFFGYSIPMYLMIIPNFVGIAMVPILSLFFEPKLIGYYSFALVFYNGIILLPNALYQVLLPKISAMHGKKQYGAARDLLVKTLISYSIVALVGIVCTIIFSGDVINILSPKYLPGLIVFQFLVSSCFLIGFLRLLQTYYSAVNKIKKVAAVIVIQNVILAAVSFFALYLVHP